MKRYLVLGASLIALSLTAAGSAQAQGTYDWSGSYFGIKTGGAIDGTANQTNVFGTSGDYDVDGFLVGIMSGYNFQQGNLVFGIDSDSSFADINGSTSALTCVISSCSTEIDYLGTTRVRAGYAMDRFLPYITGGLASALVDGSVIGVGMSSEFHWGFAAGGGLEWAVTDGWAARVEYLYIDLDNENHDIGAGSVAVDIDDMHVIRAGISMNTDWIWDSILGR